LQFLPGKTAWVQKHLSSTHYKNLFSAVLAAGILVTGISLSLAIHSNRYWPHNPGFLLSTLCPYCSPPQISSNQCCTGRRQPREFQNHRVYRSKNAALQSPL